MGDAIEAVIAAAAQPPAIPTAQLRVMLPSGRPVLLIVPTDLNAQEAVAFIGYVAVQLPAELAKLQHPGPQLIVPAHAIARG